MVFKDILNDINKDLDNIECRIIFYDSNDDISTDLFFGVCAYKNGELISLDGDDYYLDDIVEKYKYDDNLLTVWFKGYLTEN